MKPNRILLLAVLTLAAGGCAVGPNYQRPAAKAPAQWGEPLAGGETNAPANLARWWENFHDAELNSLINRALKSNHDLKIAQARLREARAHYGLAAADLLPSANASSSYARQETSRRLPVLGSLPIPSDVPFENNVYQAGFDASWEIDIFGGKRRAVAAAKAETAAFEYNRQAVEIALLGEVARNYIEARGYQSRLVIAKENIEAQTQALAITRDRFAQGLTSDLDVQQASTLLATTRATIPTLESSLHISIHRLGVLLGQEPGALLAELTPHAPVPVVAPTVPVGLPSELLLRRPDVQRAERQLAAATAKIGVAEAGLFPRFFLTGAAGFESVNTANWFTGGSSFWSVGPTVQWRIFDAGRVRAEIKVENARQEQALATYEQTVLTAFEEVENNLVSYANEQIRHQSLAEAGASSAKSLDTANKLYTNGLANYLQVLDAERSLYQAQDALAVSDRTIAANLVSLYKSLGGGWQMPGGLAAVATLGQYVSPK